MEAQEVDENSENPKLKRLDDVKFDINRVPPKDIELMRYAGASVCSAGNIHGISGQPGLGKSAILTSGIASILYQGEKPQDFLGWQKGRDKTEGAILHFDTEQSPYHHYQLCKRILWRAWCKDEMPSRFESYLMTGWKVADMQAHIPEAIDRAAQREGGVHTVWLDGIADIVLSVNDEALCNDSISWIHSLAIKYECSIWSVIHTNPNSTKTRGHLGSQLERKAENVLLLESKEDYTSVKSSKQRREGVKEYRFAWDEEQSMHKSISTETSDFCHVTENYSNDLKDVFELINKSEVKYSEIMTAFAVVCPKNKPAAFKSWIRKFKDSGVLFKNERGLYELNL